MVWLLGFLSVIAAMAGLVVMVCHLLRTVTIVACFLLIVPFIGVIGFSLLAGGIALFAFVQIFGYPYYAGSIAGAGGVTLACGHFQTRSLLSGYKNAAGAIGRVLGKKEFIHGANDLR
jgi:hypothetical protein